MNKLLLFITLSLLIPKVYACDDSIPNDAASISANIFLGLLVLSILLLPISLILSNKTTTKKNIIVLISGMLFGTTTSITSLILYNNSTIVTAVSIILLAISLFAPFFYLFIQSVKVFKNNDQNA